MQLRFPSLRIVLYALVLGMVVSLPVESAAKGEKMKVGDKMPDFKLTDLNGKEHSLSGYTGKIVVLNFCSQKCPWSRGADPSIVELYNKYKEKGIVLLGVDSHRDTAVEEIKEYAGKTKILFPILKDKENKYADAVKAVRTPEIYVVDKEGKLAYHGAFDNRRSPEKKGDVNYLTDALDELLAGSAVSKPEVAAWGCTIKRVPKEE